MKKRAQSLRPWWLLVLTVIILACGNPTPEPPPCEGTKILQPSDGAVIPLAPYTIIVHVRDKDLVLKINGSTVKTLVAEGTPHEWDYEYAWSPPAPGTYLIEAHSTYGYICHEETSDQVEVTVVGVVSQACKASSSANLYCRQGPNTSYESIDTIMPGQVMPVTGQSPDGMYLYLIGPNSHLPCAVPADTGYLELSGDCGALPIFTPGPTPVPPPSDKNQPKTPECSDGKDNDGDRLIDMSDPQCRKPEDNSESTP